MTAEPRCLDPPQRGPRRLTEHTEKGTTRSTTKTLTETEIPKKAAVVAAGCKMTAFDVTDAQREAG